MEQEAQPPAQPPEIARARPIQQQLLVKKRPPAKRTYVTSNIAPRRNGPWRKKRASKMPQDQVKKNFAATFLSLQSPRDAK